LSYDRKNREIKLLNSVPTYGADPCNIIISPNGKFVLTSNYSGGSITIFPVKKDGSLSDESHLIQFGGSGPDTIRQATSHIHCIAFSPDSTRLFADDLGADKIHEFTVNNQVVDDAASFLIGNKATDIKVAAGSGPRHITFGINGEYAYLINELSGNVITFRYADSTLRAVQYILADSSRAGGSADIHISPDGKFLYTSHRLKDDGISIFRIKSDGLLVKIGYQPTLVHPRNFAISPNGKFLLVACRDSNVIQVFKRNPATGMLTDMHKNITMNKPSCIRFIDRD
jgi:6-phosphogluconolactonase (cycloisomerase 2 family)